MDPAISVVIPTYNRALLLSRAIASALAALAQGDEILVVDDGSTDDTAAVVDRYGEPVRYLPIPHGGLAAARNAGMAAASNPLVAFLDSDDEFMADKLALQRAILARRPDLVMVISDFGHRSARGGERHHELARWTGDAWGWDRILGPGEAFTAFGPLPPGRAPFRVHIGDLYPILMSASYAAPLTAAIRRDLAGEGPWFPDDLTFHCDSQGLARIARRGPVAFLDCETAWNWRHDGPRLTDISRYAYWTEYLTVAERLWGRDEAFLARHGARYRAAVANAHRQRARWLIKEGRTREARADLRVAGGRASNIAWRRSPAGRSRSRSSGACAASGKRSANGGAPAGGARTTGSPDGRAGDGKVRPHRRAGSHPAARRPAAAISPAIGRCAAPEGVRVELTHAW